MKLLLMNVLKTALHTEFRLKNLFKALTVLVGLACFQMQAVAQGWEIYFGGNAEDYGNGIIQARDHGYVATGWSESFGADGDLDVYVVRTDVDGKLRWSNVYDEGFVEHGYSLIETTEHGFLIIGDIRTNQVSPPNAYLLKIDDQGEKLWSKQYGGSEKDLGWRIIHCENNGGYLIVGTSASSGAGGDDVFLVKIDEDGNELWSQTYGTPQSDNGRGVAEASDGYLVTGTAHNPDNNSDDIILLKTDFEGNEQWRKYFGTSGYDEGYDITATPDGNFAITGFSGSIDQQAFLAKVNPAGDEIWSTTFGNSMGDQAYDLLRISNGDLVVAGVTELSAINSDAFLARYDTDGNQLWFKSLGRGSQADGGQAVAHTEDDGFVVVGYNSAFGVFINDLTFIKTGADGLTYTNQLSGKVFKDENDDCVLQVGEPDLTDWILKAVSPTKTFFGTTDENGNYNITLDTGTYEVTVLEKNNYWNSCIASYNVTFTEQYGELVRNFPMTPVVVCPLLEVDVSTPVAMGCTNIGYLVSYCNTGTIGVAAPTIEIILDDDLTLIGSSVPVVFQNDSLYVFEVGDLDLDECGLFDFQVSSTCDGTPAQAYIVSAEIFPNEICIPVMNWDSSDIELNGWCETDSVKFTITNDGNGNMQQPQGFVIIEDHIMLQQDSIQLQIGADTTITYPAIGATYRLIAIQSPNHPGNSYPTVVIEGCAPNGAPTSTGYAAMFHNDDQDPHIAIDLQETTNSTDYITLRGYPKGYPKDGKNLIPANRDIEYHIYFQNVGTDTIDRVVIRDTLSSLLEISSVVAGASSHPYDFEVYSDGVLRFTFDNLQLLPGGGAGSQGFIKFKVSQKPNLSPNTDIPNSAAVFLGYDAPVQTATFTHTIGGLDYEEFLILSDGETPGMPGVSVKTFPNPFVSAIEFETSGTQFKTLTINVFDMNGRLLRRENASGNRIRLERRGLPSGIYAYRLEADGQPLDAGKIIVR